MTPKNHLLPNRIFRFLAVNLVLLGLSAPLLKAQVQFSSPKNNPVGARPVAAAVADLNGDAKQDLVVVNSGSRNVSILLGNGESLPRFAGSLQGSPLTVLTLACSVSGQDRCGREIRETHGFD